jgi:hypothetical protein
MKKVDNETVIGTLFTEELASSAPLISQYNCSMLFILLCCEVVALRTGFKISCIMFYIFSTFV